jgi:hypothetical protein
MDTVRRGGDTAGEIEYWQGGLRLVAFDGRDVASSLPQDEASAAVVLGALLTRHFADGAWPGEYRAVVRCGDGAVLEVGEDDLRVAAVRELLRGCREQSLDGSWVRRDFTVEELVQARELALAVGPEPESGGRR